MPEPLATRPETFRGQPCMRLQVGAQDSMLVALHGAQALSWVSQGRERLYLSPQAIFDGQTAIRGGVPLCFPQFNQRGPLRKHGFARHLPWQVVQAQGDHAAPLVLRLGDDAHTRASWPHGFVAELALQLSPGQLHMALSVRNTGSDAWSFTTALHSYLRVDDIAQVRLQGLQGCARWDALTDAHSVQQGPLQVQGACDSVLQAAAAPLQLHDGGHVLELAQSASLQQTVVWNPGAAQCAQLADMPADGYNHMLCIEAAQVDAAVALAPCAVWTGWQNLRVLAPPAGL